jgi:alanine dehydrogenase
VTSFEHLQTRVHLLILSLIDIMVLIARKNDAYSTLNACSRTTGPLSVLTKMSRIASDLAASQTRSIHNGTDERSSRSKPKHVGVVGAGVAGLRCADVLLQHGVKVTILEARNRVGGRVSYMKKNKKKKKKKKKRGASANQEQLSQTSIDGHVVDLYCQSMSHSKRPLD